MLNRGGRDISPLAAARVAALAPDAAGRHRLTAAFYAAAVPRRTRFGDAELTFLHWASERGVLSPVTGSPWWRAVNDRLLRDRVEAGLLAGGERGSPSSYPVELWVRFLREPSPRTWFRAHNAGVVAGYLSHSGLAAREPPAERFLLNLVLMRLLFAHALCVDRRVALGGLAGLGRLADVSRRGSVRLYLGLRTAYPRTYPPPGLAPDAVLGSGLVRVVDYGVIGSRLPALYGLAAEELGEPAVSGLLAGDLPAYRWPDEYTAPWLAGRSRAMARLAALATRPVRPVRPRPSPPR
ncbi:hypothetical protein [Amycolatopsis suaedae]|uniref:Uncharacterized protein n=1 Tax=Amycolatopsis suaedae TaxID=2510978 RepID=A0A4V2ELX4_9PSEU|nr:hypothetical protein [Amycolatopsis suaedae]RZQ63075.1 hypothetical protein EWH70_15415 [Amycolatopsis suaedae]